MEVYELDGCVPRVGDGTCISPPAHVIGDVRIGEGCRIGPGAVLRGDFGSITIGALDEAKKRSSG